jgi:vacuolar protein sorting-associated protein 41
LLFDDCIISGLSLYTPSLLLILAYRKHDDDDNNQAQKTIQALPRRGVHHRQTGLTPELRLINVVTKEEVDVDTLTMSRYESLSAADYHLGTLYIPPSPVTAPVQRGTFEALGGGLWDVSVNATRIFSSAVSVKSGSGSGENFLASPHHGSLGGGTAPTKANHDAHPAASSPGLKSFILSPYDCVLAVKRDLSDHLSWLLDHSRYKDAWELVNEHPEVIISTTEDLSVDESQSTPSKHGGQSLAEFFADEAASQTTSSVPKLRNTAVENERCRIGELWVHQLVSAEDWQTAGQVAGSVLGTSPRWEHWVWTFAQAGHFDEITPYIPSKPLHPPLPSLVYEVVLGHYIIHDRPRFRELMNIWEPELFNIESVTSAIENKLASDDVSEDTIDGGVQGRDWRILLEALARLKLADGKPREALKCHIRLQNADAAMKLIGEYHLVDAVLDDIPGLLTLRVPKDQQGSTPLSELEEASAEGIRLLVDEAYHGTVPPHVVVGQLELQDSSLQFFLFLYLRALWKGHGTETQSRRIRERLESEGRVLVEDFGDLAVRLFAEYDRLLLMEFLRASRSYSYEKAAAVCESKHYYPELVYLLSQTGQTKRALSLIINSLNDVSLAIEFAKEQDDAELWDDLLEYSMDKPRFIRGLLEEVGTAIDPIKLVRRIPEGLEIEGLREGIGRMVREYEIQGSISEGVARVLKGEVGTGMEALKNGRAKGIEFEVVVLENTRNETAAELVKVVNGQGPSLEEKVSEGHEDKNEPEPGHCVGCGKCFVENGKHSPFGDLQHHDG